MFIVENSVGEKFGYYLETNLSGINAETSFNFILKTHMTKQHKMKNEYQKGYRLFGASEGALVQIGNITLFKKDFKDQSYFTSEFYPHLDRSGKSASINGENRKTFDLKRFIVLQMEENITEEKKEEK